MGGSSRHRMKDSGKDSSVADRKAGGEVCY